MVGQGHLPQAQGPCEECASANVPKQVSPSLLGVLGSSAEAGPSSSLAEGASTATGEASVAERRRLAKHLSRTATHFSYTAKPIRACQPNRLQRWATISKASASPYARGGNEKSCAHTSGRQGRKRRKCGNKAAIAKGEGLVAGAGEAYTDRKPQDKSAPASPASPGLGDCTQQVRAVNNFCVTAALQGAISMFIWPQAT